MSNSYAFLARANVPLAVTLTGFSSLLAPVITPFVASSAVAWLLTSHVAIRLPVGQTMRPFRIGLVLPIVLGMLIRHFAPSWTARRQPLLTRLSLVAVAALLTYVLADQIATVAQGLRRLVLAAALFTGIAMGTGYALGWALGRELSDRTRIAIGFNGIRLRHPTATSTSFPPSNTRRTTPCAPTTRQPGSWRSPSV